MAEDSPQSAPWLHRVRTVIEAGDFLRAFDLVEQALAQHVDSPALRYQAVLALARAGATDEAFRRLQAYGLEDDLSEDVAALAGRIAKDRALAATGQRQMERAIEAARRYEAVFRSTHGYYPGINAATMHLLARDASRAAQLAAEVLPIAGCGAATEPYYANAAEAEAYLILGRAADADRALRRAAAANASDVAAIATTRRQLRMVCRLKGIDESILEVLCSPAVIHYCGHMISPPGVSGKFPSEAEAPVVAEIRETLARQEVGFGYGSLACGADILVAEALLARGAEVHVVLPFRSVEFQEISVARGGPGWVERFQTCLARAASVTYATEDSYLGDDILFLHASRLAMGLAVLRSRYLDAPICQLAITSEEPRASVAGTAADMAAWMVLGLPQTVLSSRPAALAAPASHASATATASGAPSADSPDGGPSAPAASVHSAATGQTISAGGSPESATSRFGRVIRAMLFGDIHGFSKLPDAAIPDFIRLVQGRFAEVLRHHDVQFTNTWGDGLFVVLNDAVAAAECALELQDAVQQINATPSALPTNISLRLGAHIGPVYAAFDPILGTRNFFGGQVNRTARIEPVTPNGSVYGTEPLAALLELERGSQFRCQYAGRVPSAKGFGTFRMYSIRRWDCFDHADHRELTSTKQKQL